MAHNDGTTSNSNDDDDDNTLDDRLSCHETLPNKKKEHKFVEKENDEKTYTTRRTRTTTTLSPMSVMAAAAAAAAAADSLIIPEEGNKMRHRFTKSIESNRGQNPRYRLPLNKHRQWPENLEEEEEDEEEHQSGLVNSRINLFYSSAASVSSSSSSSSSSPLSTSHKKKMRASSSEEEEEEEEEEMAEDMKKEETAEDIDPSLEKSKFCTPQRKRRVMTTARSPKTFYDWPFRTALPPSASIHDDNNNDNHHVHNHSKTNKRAEREDNKSIITPPSSSTTRKKGRTATGKSTTRPGSAATFPELSSLSSTHQRHRQHQNQAAAAEVLVNSTQLLAYSWDALNLGTDSGTTSLNQYILQHPNNLNNDTTNNDRLTAVQALQIMNTMRTRTLIPPPNSFLHRVVRKNRFENQMEDNLNETNHDENNTTSTVSSPHLPHSILSQLYEFLCYQDTDDGMAARREANHLSAQACIQRLASLENRACELTLRQESLLLSEKKMVAAAGNDDGDSDDDNDDLVDEVLIGKYMGYERFT